MLGANKLRFERRRVAAEQRATGYQYFLAKRRGVILCGPDMDMDIFRGYTHACLNLACTFSAKRAVSNRRAKHFDPATCPTRRPRYGMKARALHHQR